LLDIQIRTVTPPNEHTVTEATISTIIYYEMNIVSAYDSPSQINKESSLHLISLQTLMLHKHIAPWLSTWVG